MHQYDITILTDRRYDKPVERTPYIQNVMTEDRILQEALEEKGLKVFRTHWDNPNFDWTSTRYAIFRTTWDYFDRFLEFSQWLDITSKLTEFINPLSLIRWNMDKHYLADLQKKGIHIPDTIFIESGDKRSLSEIANEKKWEELILKPAVSGAARHTYRFLKKDISEYEQIFKSLIAEEAMLLQEFQLNILSKGELAFMLFGGKYSHSVLKKAKAGDFRVQDDFGGSVMDYQPTVDEITFAEKVIASVDTLPAYARVDVIWDNEGRPCVSELEMIEPELWLRKSTNAATLLANVIFLKYF